MFRDEPIKFVSTTATSLAKLERSDALAKVSRLCKTNAEALLASLKFCAANGIACFRINSQILPIKTHPICGYDIQELPDSSEIVRLFQEAGRFAQANRLRTCFHPDQFVVLNSLRPDVVAKSIQELEYQAEVAEWVGADVINIHGGGAYGDKLKALDDFARNVAKLSDRARSRLTVENDDKTYTPADLIPLCKSEGIPLVYDVHHHRCNRDSLSELEATELAIGTWNREPLFHISSPIEGWTGSKTEQHHDFIDVRDFPGCWLGRELTIEVEAKAKEKAVLKLLVELRSAPKPAEVWIVYILKCSDGSLYTGITSDLDRRLGQHNAGVASRYTRSRLPVIPIYTEEHSEKGQALRRELAIKKLSRNDKELLIQSHKAV
jgi:UV DNA damage endonuclease